MGDMLTASVATSADSRRRKFAEHGVVVVPGFLDREQVALLNREIDAHYGPLVRERFGIEAVSQAAIEMDCDVITWDPLGEEVEPFQVLAADPRLATLTRELIGEFSAPGSLAMWSVGGGKGQAWHQDCPPDDPSQFNLNRLFYLQDTEVDDGAVVVVPGSHRMGRISPGAPQAPIPGEVMLTPRAGTLVLLHGHIYHRVTPNVSLRPRVSVNLRAYPADVPREITRIGLYRNAAYDFLAGKRIDR